MKPQGFARDQDDDSDEAKQSQRVVCFTETPLEHAWAMFEEIEDRRREIRLRPYGLALSKVLARRVGVNPVWYVDMTPSGFDWLANPTRRLKEQAVKTGDFHSQDIARLLPFIDWMGGPFPPKSDTSKEFWWVREWRRQGDLMLAAVWDKIIWLCPSAEHEEFRTLVEDATPVGETASGIFIDPSWGLEEIVAHLAGIPAEDVSVFAASQAGDTPDEPPPVL